jgi:hypothetical protein
MAKLIYSALTSLDGYVADEDGNFDWAKPDEEVHTFVNDLERAVGTYLYGRRMYEVMVAWETTDRSDQPPCVTGGKIGCCDSSRTSTPPRTDARAGIRSSASPSPARTGAGATWARWRSGLAPQ